MTHPTILAALASLRLAIRAAQRARRALYLLALVGVGGCDSPAAERCTDTASGYVNGRGTFDRCAVGSQVSVEYLNDRTWVICRCPGSRDGGQ